MRAKIASEGFGAELYVKAISKESWDCIQNDYMGDGMAYMEDNPWIILEDTINYRAVFLQKGGIKVVSETNETLYQQIFADNTVERGPLQIFTEVSLYDSARYFIIGTRSLRGVFHVGDLNLKDKFDPSKLEIHCTSIKTIGAVNLSEIQCLKGFGDLITGFAYNGEKIKLVEFDDCAVTSSMFDAIDVMERPN